MNWETTINDSELMHYGVKGMKWGVRRGRVDAAYGRASRKLRRLDKKVQKAQGLARRAEKTARSEYRINERAEYYEAKGYDGVEARVYARTRLGVRANYYKNKARRKAKKAADWYKAMEETFKGTSVSLTKEQQAMGRRFSELMLTEKKKR